MSPCLTRQPSVGNVLARTSSFCSSASSSSGTPSSAGSAKVQRQGSQGSLFEQFASQAKELVRETTRQSSQEGLLAQMDKVNHGVVNCCVSMLCLIFFLFCVSFFFSCVTLSFLYLWYRSKYKERNY